MTARAVPVPTTCTALYAVMTPAAIGPATHLVLPHDSLMRRRGTSEAAVAALHARPHQHLMRTQVPARIAAEAMRAARVDALELAATHDGVVVELLMPRVLEIAAADVSLSHAAQWYVLDYGGLDEGRLLTHGLSDSFGVPEILVRGVAASTHAMTDAVVAGLAHRLIEEWPANDPVGPATVTLRDIAYGLGDSQAATTPADRTLDLLIDYDGQHLVVELMGDPATALFS